MPPAPSLIEKWYRSHRRDWEHAWGVDIETLDNPGWPLRKPKLSAARGWAHLPGAQNQFAAACGPLNLSEAFTVFDGKV
jgi:hypothetical protein